MEILGIISMVLAIIVIIQTHRNYKFSRLVAKHQGVFRAASIKVSIYEEEFLPDYFIFACCLRPKRILLIPLLLGLVNKGDKSAKNVKIHIRSPARLHAGLKGVDIKLHAPKDVSYEVFEEEKKFVRKITNIDTIRPKEGYTIQNLVSVNEQSFLDFDVDSISKNGFKFTTNFEMTYYNQIEYFIYFDDSEPIFGLIKTYIIDTAKQSLDEFMNLRNQKMREKYRNDVGNFIRQIFHFIKLRYVGQKTIKKFSLIRYDDSQLIRHSDMPFDEVPIQSIRISEGIEDIRGCQYIPVLGIK